MSVKSVSFASHTGEGQIQGRIYLPAFGRPQQLLQIVHGMAEHMARYDSFCSMLAKKGLAVCIQDLAGHGLSAAAPEKLGYFGTENGYIKVLDDVQEMAGQAIAIIGEKEMPRFILGHSMGSFIARLYCARYGEQLTGAIFSGTRGADSMVNVGIMLARRSVRKNGALFKDEFLAGLTGKGFLKRIKNARTPVDWLSRDSDIVDAYLADPLCGFTFTAAGYLDLYRWIREVSSRQWAQQVPRQINILLFAGEEDPVSSYGRGPKQVAGWLKDSGHQVELVLYPGGRHEMLNETNREDVWQMVLDWLDGQKKLEAEIDYD